MNYAAAPVVGYPSHANWVLLGLPYTSNMSKVKKAYLAKALRTHPNKAPAGSSNAVKAARAREFARIGQAYERILHSLSRRASPYSSPRHRTSPPRRRASPPRRAAWMNFLKGGAGKARNFAFRGAGKARNFALFGAGKARNIAVSSARAARGLAGLGVTTTRSLVKRGGIEAVRLHNLTARKMLGAINKYNAKVKKNQNLAMQLLENQKQLHISKQKINSLALHAKKKQNAALLAQRHTNAVERRKILGELQKIKNMRKTIGYSNYMKPALEKLHRNRDVLLARYRALDGVPSSIYYL